MRTMFKAILSYGVIILLALCLPGCGGGGGGGSNSPTPAAPAPLVTLSITTPEGQTLKTYTPGAQIPAKITVAYQNLPCSPDSDSLRVVLTRAGRSMNLPASLFQTAGSTFSTVQGSDALSSSSVAIYSIQDQAALSRVVTAPWGYRHMATSPDAKRAFLWSETLTTIENLSLETGLINNAIQLPGAPVDVLAGASGDHLYTLLSDGSLTEWDAATGNTTRSLGAVVQNPTGMAMDPTLNRIYVAQRNSSIIAALNVSTGAITSHWLDVGFEPQSITAGSNKLFITGLSGAVPAIHVFDGAGSQLGAPSRTNEYPTMMIYDESTGMLFALLYGRDRIITLDPVTGTMAEHPTSENPLAFALNNSFTFIVNQSESSVAYYDKTTGSLMSSFSNNAPIVDIASSGTDKQGVIIFEDFWKTSQEISITAQASLSCDGNTQYLSEPYQFNAAATIDAPPSPASVVAPQTSAPHTICKSRLLCPSR